LSVVTLLDAEESLWRFVDA